MCGFEKLVGGARDEKGKSYIWERYNALFFKAGWSLI